jgi:hypothetical protein
MPDTPWPLSEDDVEWMLQATALERYVYFIERISWWDSVWIRSDSADRGRDSSENAAEGVRLWPHEFFARESTRDGKAGDTVEALSTRAFVSRYLRSAKRAASRFEVFPLPGKPGLVVDSAVLYADYLDMPHLRNRMLGFRPQLPQVPVREEHLVRHCQQTRVLRRSSVSLPRRRVVSIKREWHLERPEFECMVREPGWARYVYFVQIVSWQGPVWLLADESGYKQSLDDEGNHYLAVWPHADYARECSSLWSGACFPEALPTRFFISKYLKAVKGEPLKYEVFPVIDGSGYLTDAHDLLNDYSSEQSSAFMGRWSEQG